MLKCSQFAFTCAGLLSLVILSPLGIAATSEVPTKKVDADIEVFVRKGCPHCEAAKRFLDSLLEEHPALRIVTYDLEENSEALARLRRLAGKLGITHLGVPAFYVRGELIVGYSSEATTGQQLRMLLGRPPPRLERELPEGTCTLQSGKPCGPSTDDKEFPQEGITIPFLGLRTVSDLGLPLFTIAIGLLDGFNPCAMWVLLFLLSLLATLRDRRKMFLLAGTFVLVSGLVYFVFMAAWLNVFLLIGYSRVTQTVLGLLATVVGGINLKDFFVFRRGITLSVPEAAKPTLYAKIRQVIVAENVRGALLGIIVLAFLVNLIELACTAGFPAMYTKILTLQDLGWIEYYSYLALYNVAYLADDACIVTLAVVTLSHRKLQEREGRWLKLVSGTVMVGLGITLLISPKWLS